MPSPGVMFTTDVPLAVTAVKYWLALKVNTSTELATIEIVGPLIEALATAVAVVALGPKPR